MARVVGGLRVTNSPWTLEYGVETDGRWLAEIRALPGCRAYGATSDEARRRVMALALEILGQQVEDGVWDGETPPRVEFDDANRPLRPTPVGLKEAVDAFLEEAVRSVPEMAGKGPMWRPWP